MEALILLAISAIAGFGLVVCAVIRSKKKNHNVCDPTAKCDTVTTSRYSTFFGIPLETMGFVYYTVLSIATLACALAALAAPELLAYRDTISFILLGLTGAGFAMSCYLAFAQAFYLRTYCPWCLRSAFASTLSFGLAWYLHIVSGAHIVPILIDANGWLVKLHLGAFALALVAATISDVVVIRFLRSFTASPIVERTFRVASQATVALLFLVVLTFVGIYLPDVVTFGFTPTLAVEIVAILVVIGNAAFLNLFVSPYLYDMVAMKTVSIDKARALRRIAFALAAISFVSWYTAFALAIYHDTPYGVGTLIASYAVLAFGAVAISQAFEALTCDASATMR